jgi:hypothetical protein
MRIFIWIACLYFFTGCKNNSAPSPNAEGGQSTEVTINQSANIDAFYPMLNQSDLSTMEVANYRKSAYDIVHHRNKELGNKVYTILAKDSWKYDGIFKGSSFIQPDSLHTRWINFKDNLTYEYGQDREVKGKGIYTYNFDTGLLLMLDDNTTIKPNEYNVKAHNELIILEGQSTYEDNNIQAKLVRIPDFAK